MCQTTSRGFDGQHPVIYPLRKVKAVAFRIQTTVNWACELVRCTRLLLCLQKELQKLPHGPYKMYDEEDDRKLPSYDVYMERMRALRYHELYALAVNAAKDCEEANLLAPMFNMKLSSITGNDVPFARQRVRQPSRTLFASGSEDIPLPAGVGMASLTMNWKDQKQKRGTSTTLQWWHQQSEPELHEEIKWESQDWQTRDQSASASSSSRVGQYQSWNERPTEGWRSK